MTELYSPFTIMLVVILAITVFTSRPRTIRQAAVVVGVTVFAFSVTYAVYAWFFVRIP